MDKLFLDIAAMKCAVCTNRTIQQTAGYKEGGEGVMCRWNMTGETSDGENVQGYGRGNVLHYRWGERCRGVTAERLVLLPAEPLPILPTGFGRIRTETRTNIRREKLAGCRKNLVRLLANHRITWVERIYLGAIKRSWVWLSVESLSSG